MKGDIRMKTIRESRFLQASLPIRFTGIFQAYMEIIYKMSREKCFVKTLVLRYNTT